MATSENMTWEEWCEGNWDREKISKPSEYIPIDEQLKIQNNMIGDLKAWQPKQNEIIYVSCDRSRWASRVFLRQTEWGQYICLEPDNKESSWQYAKSAGGGIFGSLNALPKLSPGKVAILKNGKMDWVDVIPEFGNLYEFYDDENYSQELVLIGQGAGKYFGISQDDYDEITKGWEGTVHAYNNVREVKVYPEITPEQIAEKFDIPVTKLVIEGYNKITDEEKKEAINKIMFSASNNYNNGLLDKEMD